MITINTALTTAQIEENIVALNGAIANLSEGSDAAKALYEQQIQEFAQMLVIAKQNENKGENNTMTTPDQLIDLTLRKTEGTVASIEALLMQDSISETLINETLTSLFIGFNPDSNKAVKANLLARAMEMDWEELDLMVLDLDTPASVETTVAEENTTNTKGEKETMTTTTNTTTNGTVNTKEEVKMTKKVIEFSKGNLTVIQNASVNIVKALMNMGVTAPSFSRFIGLNAQGLTVDVRRNKFVVLNADDTKESIQFSSAKGKQVIDYLMVVMPGLFPRFKESAEFKALEKLNLKGRLTVKAKLKGKKTRETVIMAALNMDDIYVVSDGSVISKLRDFSLEELMDSVMEEIETEKGTKVVLRKGIRFFIAKDTKIENLNNIHSLFQKMSGSLAAYRFAMKKGKKAQTLNIVKEYAKDGMVMKIEEPVQAIVLDEMCTFDGSGSLPFGEEVNGAVLKAVFSQVHVVNKEDGVLAAGENVSEMESFSYRTYTKSMSQARSNGAVGFKSIDDVVEFFLGTGQDDRTYAKTHKDANGIKTGYNVMDVAKSYKRFMLAGSNGLKADKGLLSTFSHNHTVKHFPAGEKNVIGEIQPEYIEITNANGETITIAIVEDFFAEIPVGSEFLLNTLDENNALIGVDAFKHWKDENAIKALLRRNGTDGQGYHNSRITEELREAGVINGLESFQERISNAVKGLSVESDLVCDLLKADIVLTEGMIKSENIVTDIKENGFQLFVVGQRKEGLDGIWIASQALQQMGLSAAELKLGLTNTVDFVQKSIKESMTSNILTMFNATEDEEGTEFAGVDYVRLAEEFGDVLDEQYIKDEIVGLAVKKLNKLLDSKLFTTQARTRYMVTDMFAIYNAAKAGRYTMIPEDAVLKAYEVVAPSKNADGFYLEEGKAISVRFPVTVSHEIPVVTAVQSKEYMEFVKQGKYQGVTFFDAFSWVVAQQAGADHDGDTSIIIFDSVMVNARLRMESALYGGKAILPFIDAYVKLDVDGNPVQSMNKDGELTTEGAFGTGCPTYITESAKKNKVESVYEEVNGFLVKGSSIIFDAEDAATRRTDFLTVMADMAQGITVDTIEGSLIGLIANRAMILTDLLSRTVLTPEQRAAIELDMLLLTTAGRWEIDRPKHGGAYLEMPLVKALFANFDSRFFTEAEMELTDEAKRTILVEEKRVYTLLFDEVKREGKLTGFEVKKPNWLASQKDEYGKVNRDSSFEQLFTDANVALEEACNTFAVGHSDTAKNNIRTRVIHNMEAGMNVDHMKQVVFNIYAVYSDKENLRAAGEKQFRMQAEAELKEAGVFRKKNMQSLTKAKKTAKIRAAYDKQMNDFKNARDLYKAELRKEVYAAAKELGYDVRALVGALYLIVNEAKTNGSAKVRRDGREYRFIASNGFIALPFEVFAEEMSSLISGKISETYFVPQDLTFTLLQSSLVPGGAVVAASSNQAKVRVLNPIAKTANKTVAVNRTVRVAIKPEQQKNDVRLVMYFLNKDSQVMDYMEVTNADAAYKGFAPTNSMVGIYEINVSEIAFGEEGTSAVVRF